MSTGIGPIFVTGKIPDLWVRALKEINPNLSVTNQGSYLRITVPKNCILTRDVLEKHLGVPVKLSLAITEIMVSFSGTISIDEDRIVWSEI